MEWIATFIVALLLAPSHIVQSHAQERVSIELVMATDISISVDAQEYQLQMQGIADALRSPEIIQTILELPDGAAIALVHWSVAHLNRVAVPWRLLTSEASILAFANEVQSSARLNTGRSTAIGDAIDFSARQIRLNQFKGEVLKIDISGDERSNSGPRPSQARDRATASGITVNGLAILGTDKGLYNYYKSYVIGGPSAFVISVDGFVDFHTAIKNKLQRELTNTAYLMD